MRTIRTFILRLLIDSAEPERLNGILQSLPEEEKVPFQGERALLDALQGMAAPKQAPGAGENGGKEPGVGNGKSTA